MKVFLNIILFWQLVFSLKSQTFKISENGHFLLKNNQPFMWMGDTAWELFHKLNKEEADFYLKKRAEQGFTVIQAVALAELDGINTPNAYGEYPLINNDPTTPNEKYFKHIDFLIEKADSLHLNIGFLPTWGDKIFKDKWGKGPEIFTFTNAKIYGKWLGERYKNRTNIIWILGGDRNPRPNTSDIEIWNEMAKGIEEGVGGEKKALITYHPQPNEQGSGEWFHNQSWFDFNMFQNGHCRDMPSFDNSKLAYNRNPIKPFLDGEPIYEDHPVCFNERDLGLSSAYDVRKAAYLDLFSGAFGHTYGCHDVWQMYSPKFEPVNNPHIYWQKALDLPGANQMKFVRKLLESRPFLDRVPDQSIIVENKLNPNERIQATRGKDYAFIYTATGKKITYISGKIMGKTLNAYWYNTRTGNSEFIRKFENNRNQQFNPPKSGYGQDWVLVIDDSSKNYPKP